MLAPLRDVCAVNYFGKALKMKFISVFAAVVFALQSMTAFCSSFPHESYQKVSQADLIKDQDAYQGKKVKLEGEFLFSGSDFCYQIRKTKINTRDYLCFAISNSSPLGNVRLYLKKDHPQADQLMNLKKGVQITAYGTFDFIGKDYNYVVVEEIEVGATK